MFASIQKLLTTRHCAISFCSSKASKMSKKAPPPGFTNKLRPGSSIFPSPVAVSSPKNASGSVLMWFRNDLRVNDNPALLNASKVAKDKGVVAVYIIAEKEWKAHDLAPCKIDFILRTLVDLRRDLWDNYSIPLLIRNSSFLPRRYESQPPDELSELETENTGLTPQVLLDLCRETGCTSLFFNQEYEWDELQRDIHVTNYLSTKGINVQSFHDQCVAPPGSILTNHGKPFIVFTPFRTAWYRYIDQESVSLSKFPRKNGRSLFADLKQDPIPDFVEGFEMKDDAYAKTVRGKFPAGSSAAHRILDDFVAKRIAAYSEMRDIPSVDGCSALSPYLSIGSISVRECLLAAISQNGQEPDFSLIRNGNKGIVHWISELCWREFYRHIMFLYPKICKNKPFIDSTLKIWWENDPVKFQKWCEGKTGFPIVDAGMRELNATGWTSNRLRQICASFLVKDLLIDWRWGEAYFMRHLIDGDLASNNGGWQWVSSTGNDSAPYFRVFNPLMQSQKYDPKGDYIRKWVTELLYLKSTEIHQPYERVDAQHFRKLNYPEPMVDHEQARRRAADAFKVAFNKEDRF